MVAVQMSGGLGNQMFEYALYRKLKALGKEVKMDDFTCYGPGQRTKQLEVFGVSYDRLTKKEYEKLTDSCMLPWHRIRRKLTGRKNLSYREKSCNFDPEILRRDPALFEGYFQTEKYFADIEDEIREAFTFRNFKPSALVQKYAGQMQGCSSVSVHVRRGDYLKPENQALFGGICSEAYYEEAIAEMKKSLPGATFFFFSNDTDWVRRHFKDPAFVIVEGNDEDNGYADLYLMSRCKNHILANSSFSWWGAWLDESPDKKVIAPKKWFNGRDFQDIYTEGMRLL